MVDRVSSVPAALAARARSSPHDPWLFHRDGWDWCWRSWSRVADQVARGAEELRRWSSRRSRSSDDRPRVGFDARQDPDAIAVGLAIRAAGAVAVPVTLGAGTRVEALFDAWAEVESGTAARLSDPIERVLLPAALSPLERTHPQSLELEPDRAPGALVFADGEPSPPGAMTAAARRLDEDLPPSDETPIVCAAPDLDPRTTRLIEAWTLLRGAAWVLEPDSEAFVPTVLWARPTLVFGRAADLDRLAARLRVRKHRRRSRLSAVVAEGEPADPEACYRLGIQTVAL